jgi:hypothetical protein
LELGGAQQSGADRRLSSNNNTVDQAFDLVMAYVRDHPEYRHWHRAALVLIAIKEKLPTCDLPDD